MDMIRGTKLTGYHTKHAPPIHNSSCLVPDAITALAITASPCSTTNEMGYALTIDPSNPCRRNHPAIVILSFRSLPSSLIDPPPASELSFFLSFFLPPQSQASSRIRHPPAFPKRQAPALQAPAADVEDFWDDGVGVHLSVQIDRSVSQSR